MDKRTESMIVACARCGAPGKVLFDRVSNMITKSHFACKCPREPLVQRPLTTDESDDPVEMGS